MGRSAASPIESKSPRRSRAVARALVAQRRSLVWPVTASARPGSFLARVGTCRAGPAAPLGVPATARRLLPLSPLLKSLSFLMPAAAANPCASLQGGLVREAAVGRRRREVLIKDAPPQPRSSVARQEWSGWKAKKVSPIKQNQDQRCQFSAELLHRVSVAHPSWLLSTTT